MKYSEIFKSARYCALVLIWWAMAMGFTAYVLHMYTDNFLCTFVEYFCVVSSAGSFSFASICSIIALDMHRKIKRG